MDREDMRRLISYGNVYSKDTKRELSAITVKECLNFMEFEIVEYMLYQYLIVIDFSFYQSNI